MSRIQNPKMRNRFASRNIKLMQVHEQGQRQVSSIMSAQPSDEVTINPEFQGPAAAAVTSDGRNQGEVTTEDVNVASSSHVFTDPPTSPTGFDSDKSNDDETYQGWVRGDFMAEKADTVRRIQGHHAKVNHLYLRLSRLEFNQLKVQDEDDRASKRIKPKPKAPPSEEMMRSSRNQMAIAMMDKEDQVA